MGLSTKDVKKLAKASALSHSKNPKDWDSARARQTEVDYKDLVRQLKAKRKKKMKEGFVLEREDSPYEKASDKALDKKYGYGTSHDKGPKTGFGRASNRNTAAAVLKDIRRRKSKSTSETRADAAHKGWSATARTSKDQTPEKKATRKKLADTPYKKLPKDEKEKDQVAADAVKKEYDKRKKNESFEIDKDAHNKAKKKAKLRNLARGNENPAEKKAAERKAGGPKLYGEEDNYGQAKKELKATKKARDERHKAIHSGTNTAKNTDVNEGRTFADWKKAAAKVLKKKDQEKKPQKAMDAGARAKRKLQRREYAAKVSGSEDNVPDEMRD